MFNPEITALIICDQIRREDNGKELIIGAYSGDILFHQFPLVFTFFLYVGFDAPPFKSGEFRFRVELDDGTFSELEGSIDSSPDVPIQGALISPPISIEVKNPGSMAITAQFGDDVDRLLLTKKIKEFPVQA